MNYSVVVWGFDNENDYYNDRDIITRNNIRGASSITKEGLKPPSFLI